MGKERQYVTLNFTEAAAQKLADLSREVDTVESGRLALLARVDRIRAYLEATGDRTAAVRATVDLMCEHLTNVLTAQAELQALEQEMQEIEGGLQGVNKETSALLFETESLQETVEDAEQELERLSTILIEGKTKYPRGH
jgi:septation ring formation regulator EzrA